MVNKINQKAVNLVKEFEGYEDRLPDGRCMAYLDRNATPSNPDYDHSAGGLWTIGYGATGNGIKKGTTWTQAQADADLSVRLDQKGKEVLAKLTVPINDNQYGALASISYNIGTYGIRGLLAQVNADPTNAGRYFVNYNHGTVNGQLVAMAGLTRRRLAERELYEWEVPTEVVALSPQLQQADQVQGGLAVGGLGLAGAMNYIPSVSAIMHDNIGAVLLIAAGAVFGIVYLWKRGFHIAFNDGTYVPVGTKVSPEVPVAEIEEVPTDANPA